MSKKIDNFEDAKIVLKNTSKSDFFKHRLRVNKLRGLFATVISAAAAATVGLVSGNPVLGMILFPLNEIVIAPVFFPYFLLKKSAKLSQDEEYLNSLGENKVIDIANRQIEASEEYEKNKKSR